MSPDDLNINGRRQTEVQYLRDDVGCLEEERQIRELRIQLAPQLFHVVPGWPMLLLVQGDEDLAVRCPDRRRIAEGQVNPTDRQPDIV